MWCKELYEQTELGHLLIEQLSTNSLPQQLKSLCVCLGVTILLKGESDMICGSYSETISSNEEFSCSNSSSNSNSSWDEKSVSDVFILHSSQQSNSPRRCGGQGDILAGCVGVSIHWTTSVNEKHSLIPLESFDLERISTMSEIEIILLKEISPIVQGCILASIVTKKAAYLAFEKKGRSTTSPDIMKEIGKALELVINGGE